MNKLFRFCLCLLLPVLLTACSGRKHAKILNEQNYSLQYDEDWYLDNYDEAFDPDYYFLISSRDENAFISMFFYEGNKDAAALLQEKAAQHIDRTITVTSQRLIGSWGNYKGSGMVIKGMLMGTEKAELTLFVHSDTHMTFLVVSQVLEADKKKFAASFKLVENSFRIREE
jgi:hypothetical protein